MAARSEFEMWRYGNIASDMCVIEATVNTGLEYVAKDEVLEKIKAVNVVVSRGRLFIELRKNKARQVLQLRSIDNCLVLLDYICNASLPQDELAVMDFLCQLVPKLNWKTALEVWSDLNNYPHYISPDSAFDPPKLATPELVFCKSAAEKCKTLSDETSPDRNINNASTVISESSGNSDFTHDLETTMKSCQIPKTNSDAVTDCSLYSEGVRNYDESDIKDKGFSVESINRSNIADEKHEYTSGNCTDLSSMVQDTNEIASSLKSLSTSYKVIISTTDSVKLSDDEILYGHATKTTPTFRVTCNRTGKGHKFTSMCAAANFGGAIQNYFDWKVDMTHFDIEVVLDIDGYDIYVGLCLTKKSLHRRTLSLFGPTSLRPSIAYNLLRLCDIQPGDIVCDPMCGGGTISLEGALEWSSSFNLAGEIHKKGVERTQTNLDMLSDTRGSVPNLSIDVLNWDVTKLPLRNGSVDVFVTDLPFGKRLGNKGQNWHLYPKVLHELARVCTRSTGKACFLTQDRKCFSKCYLETTKYWKKHVTLWTTIGGLEAGVYVLHRTNKIV